MNIGLSVIIITVRGEFRDTFSKSSQWQKVSQIPNHSEFTHNCKGMASQILI